MTEKLLLGCRVSVQNEGPGKVIRMGIKSKFIGRMVVREGTYTVQMDDGRELVIDRNACVYLGA